MYELKVERIARANLFSKLQLLGIIVGKKVAKNEKPHMHINKNKTRAIKTLDICLVQDEFAFFSAIASRQLNVF